MLNVLLFIVLTIMYIMMVLNMMPLVVILLTHRKLMLLNMTVLEIVSFWKNYKTMG
jgi:hypothetical protein